VGVDSTEPDLDYGRIGRHRYPWIKEAFTQYPDDFRIFLLHHHLLPIPGTGRERNIVNDAGDVLEVLIECGVELVLSGHKHVPYAWRLENMFVVNAGTVATLRLRGDTKPCYNVIEIVGNHVTISRRYPFHGAEVIVEFDAAAQAYPRDGCRVEAEPG
jgi:3',5'-cyclic AMP phosphodiesterase CpdA